MSCRSRSILMAMIGIILGVAVSEAIQAQTKPPIYVVTEINVKNPQAFGKEYAPMAQASIKAAGGHALARGGSGGAGALRIIPIEGPTPKRVALLEFADMQSLEAWRNSEAYKTARTIGDKYATFKSYAIEGFRK